MNLKGSNGGNASPPIRETKNNLHEKPKDLSPKSYYQDKKSGSRFEWFEGGKLIPLFLSHLALF